MEADRMGATLTDQNFQTMVLEREQPVLVACWAEGCGPWHMLAPEVAALAEAFRGQAAVGTLDVEAEPETPKRYGIQTLPAVLFLQDGEVVDELTGVGGQGRDSCQAARPDADQRGMTTELMAVAKAAASSSA
jgi:thioredoxin 1